MARIQLGILLAMLEGVLALDAPEWSIGVVERDLPVADIAVIDLHQQLTQLCALYDLGEPPSIDVSIARTHRHDPPAMRWFAGVFVRRLRPEGILKREVDVIIDVSVRTRLADLRVDDPLPPDQFTGCPIYELRSAYRRLPEEPLPWPTPRRIEDPIAKQEHLTYFLQLLFRKSAFRAKQLEIVARALQRRDVLGLLPTGGGKSLTFQLPTLLSPGIAIIVAPLKSLIDDQVDNLHRVGINRVVGIHSGQTQATKDQSLALIAQGHPRFLYIAPERFHIQAFRHEMANSVLSQAVSFVVVDEAHCVSEWGHDFRPAYLSVADQARRLFQQGETALPIIALTATASDTVLIDIQRELGFDQDDDEALVSIESFSRKELTFLPLHAGPQQKPQALRAALEEVAATIGVPANELLADPDKAGVVFCRYVNGAFGVWGVRGALCAETGGDVETIRVYSGSQPKAYQGPEPWEDYKQRVQRGFKDNAFPLLVATSSFGMGIDKPNIRYTLHYGIPHSVEALAQEAGRAGRDKTASACAIVYTAHAPLSRVRYLDPELSLSQVKAAIEDVPRSEQDDVYRLMFLHGTSYPGAGEEFVRLRETFDRLQESWTNLDGDGAFADTLLPRRSRNSKDVEKAVYRLKVLGVVDDYTVDYRGNTITVQSQPLPVEEIESRLATYITRYDTPQRAVTVLAAARARRDPERPYDHVLSAMCDFVYDVIERSRRAALRNLVERIERANGDGKALAQEIEIFLSQNIFSAAVADIVDRLDVEEWFVQLDRIRRGNRRELARRLVATCQRQLESYPTHPGLHLLVGLGTLRQEHPDTENAPVHLWTALQSYTEHHGQSPEALSLLVNRILKENQYDLDQDLAELVIASLLDRDRTGQIARIAYSFASSTAMRRRCAVPWLRSMARQSRLIRHTTLELAR